MSEQKLVFISTLEPPDAIPNGYPVTRWIRDHWTYEYLREMNGLDHEDIRCRAEAYCRSRGFILVEERSIAEPVIVLYDPTDDNKYSQALADELRII